MFQLTKRSISGAAAGALLLAAAACADRSTAPAAPESVRSSLEIRPNHLTGMPGGRPGSRLASGDVAVFTVDPARGGTFHLADGHWIYFPANAICDRARSSYGIGTWDKSCALAHQPITITATSLVNALGQPFVDFEPAMRFAPSSDPRSQVWLYLYAPNAASLGTFQIDYCIADIGCIDEANSDPTLVTHRIDHDPYLYRRLEHFSGYNVSVGRATLDQTAPVSY